MLISFEVENFRSIYERQGISFSVSGLKDNEDGIIETRGIKDGRLLPALLLYGANASGKSNLVKALDEMAKIVLYSQTRGRPVGRIPTYKPFLLDSEASNKPAIFEINFMISEVRYNYGFAIEKTEVIEEWLFSYPHGSPRRLFERKGMVFEYGKHLKGQNKTVESIVRKNSLFLSAGAQNGHKQLGEAFDFFDSIQVEASLSVSGGAAERRIKDEHHWEIDNGVIEFLETMGSGIVGYRIKDKEISDQERNISKKLGLAVKSAIAELGEDLEVQAIEENDKVVELEHRGAAGTSSHFPLHLESSGTLRLLSALPKILGVLQTGGLVVVDELDLSLHTQAAEEILGLFCSRKHNPKGAQLFATVHDTNLLDSRHLRRDQIWFVEKSKIGSSQIYPLSDIKTRISDNIEKGYLQSRFGATPF